MKLKFKIITIVTVMFGITLSSCDNYFDIETEDMLDVSDAYKEKSTIYAGMMGLAANFRETADHHIILSELLGDLMKPTTSAPDECWDVYRYKATNGNSFASPAPYYKLIINCNDFLKHTIDYNKKYPAALAANVYKGMISSALTYRAWSYLQIGKIFGEAVYYDVVFTDDNEEMPSKVMNLDELVEELIYNLKNGVDGVNGFQTLDWNTLISPQNTYTDETWSRVSIAADVLLTELYLWNKDYTNAAKTALNYVSNSAANFKLDIFQSNNNNMMWYKMFTSPFSSDCIKEVCTYAPFNFEKRQTSKLQYYFSSLAPNVYYFMPHTNAQMRFFNQITGESKNELTGETGLVRGTDVNRRTGTFVYENGKSVIAKYHMNKKNYEHDSPIYIYRAPEIYLMIAEALGGLGGETNIAAADSIISVGLKSSWNSDHFEKPFEAPIFGNSLNVFPGIRGRAKMGADFIRYHVDTVQYPGKTDLEKIQKAAREKFVLDSLIAEETALELAYEGKRWFTLIRLARNSENPAFLAQQAAKKFDAGEGQLYEKWLMNPENWFIKWNQTQVLNELKKEE
mgnify:FL=1